MRIIVSSLILAAGLVASTCIFTDTWRSQGQTLKVVGSATLNLSSDLGFLSGSIGTAGSSSLDAFRLLEAHRPIVEAHIREQGFTELQFFAPSRNDVIEYNEKGRMTGKILRYEYFQRFEVRSGDVKRIEALSLGLGSLVEKGVSITVETPRYVSTKLAELKVQAQSLAAADAMKRAGEISKATGSRLGVLQEARMGVLQITPLHSTEISDYGVNDTSSIEKQITAVVQASFKLD